MNPCGLSVYQHDEKEEELYLKKIQELVCEKMIKMLADQNSNEIKKTTPVTIKKEIKKTGSCSKRPRTLTEEDVDGTKKKMVAKKKKTIIRTLVVSNHVTEGLKEFITREMNGSDMKLVIQKILYTTDLKRDQNRLSMPMNQVETHEFLTADEMRDLESGGEMAVPLLGPRMRMHEDKESMVLKIWHMKSTNNYVLKSKWNEFVKENKEDLTEGTKIQVWSFRREQKLCFAIACVDH